MARRRKGKTVARNRLVTDHLTLVSKIARRMMKSVPWRRDFSDLVSAGTIGLIKAADSFNPRLSDDFSNWAILKIRGAILDEMKGSDHLTPYMRKRAKTIRSTHDKLTTELGRHPTIKELAAHLGIASSMLEEHMIQTSDVFLVTSDHLDLVGGKSSEESKNPEVLAIHREIVEVMKNEFLKLTQDMQKVLIHRYVEGKTFKAIGHILGLSEARIWQIEGEALSELKWRLALLGVSSESSWQ